MKVQCSCDLSEPDLLFWQTRHSLLTKARQHSASPLQERFVSRRFLFFFPTMELTHALGAYSKAWHIISQEASQAEPALVVDDWSGLGIWRERAMEGRQAGRQT